MSIKSIALFVFAIVSISVCSGSKGGVMAHQGNSDSIINRTDNYIKFVNGFAAHGNRFMKVYVMIAGHSKFKHIIYFSYWPDSITQTVNVVYYQGEPVEYSETPTSTSAGTDIEYDNYYYKGKLLAYRFFKVTNHSDCTNGSLTNTFTEYFDSTGKSIKTIQTLMDANDKAVTPAVCPSASTDLSHIYKTYSETPLARQGSEP